MLTAEVIPITSTSSEHLGILEEGILMNQRSYPYLVSKQHAEQTDLQQSDEAPIELIAARRLSDKASLLRPLQDEHLLEVYREAKKLNLSNEFIELLEEAISMRQLQHLQQA
jgi:developmental checkpoint coupling sporulation initiation to replication initiation